MFRADHVGSLLRPRPLRDAFRRHSEGTLSDADFEQAQDDAIRAAVGLQEDAGLEAITDGEFRRASYWSHFVAAVDGLDVGPARFAFTDGEQTTAFTAPVATGPLRRAHPISAAELAFLRSATDRTPKITLPSPSTMHFWRGPETFAGAPYETLAEYLDALVAIFTEELAELDAPYAQLDEVALAMLCDPDVCDAVRRRGEDPEALVDLYVGAVRAIADARPDGTALSMHLCRGNYKGSWMASGGYEPVAEQAFGGAGVDALFCEFDSPRAGDFAPLRFATGDVRVVLGLVSSKTPQLESRDELLRRIEAATAYVPIERLGLSPQCGFASTVAGNPLTEDDERRKLELVVGVAREVWPA